MLLDQILYNKAFCLALHYVSSIKVDVEPKEFLAKVNQIEKIFYKLLKEQYK